MPTSNEIATLVTRLVRPIASKLSTRETIEAHADHICSRHNRLLRDMQTYLDSAKVENSQIKAWADSFSRDDPKVVATMRGVLNEAIVKAPAFQGLSDVQAIEAYGRLLVNLVNLEVLGNPAFA